MHSVDLLWFKVPVRIGIWEANPNIKERRLLAFPETMRLNIQPCVLCNVSFSIELFPIYVLEDGFDFDIAAYRTKELRLQVFKLIMSLDDKSASFTNQGVVYRKELPSNTRRKNIINWPVTAYLIASRNFRLFGLKPIHRRGSTVSDTDDSFSAVRFLVVLSP